VREPRSTRGEPGDGPDPTNGTGLPGSLGYSIATEGERIIATAPFAPDPGLRVFGLHTGAAILVVLVAGVGVVVIARRRRCRPIEAGWPPPGT
jgi:hypothetical protein